METQSSRRQFLKSTLASSSMLLTSGAMMGGCSTSSPPVRSQAQWDKEAALVKQRINAPSFPNYAVSISDILEAQQRELGSANVRQAIHTALAKVAQNGGGKVIIPPGVHYCDGPLHLISNTNLHLEKGATLTFSTNPEDYKPFVFTRWEGMELMGYSPLIYAFEQENIAITGEGTIDGAASADNWWPWKGKWKSADWGNHPVANQKFTRDALQVMVEEEVPVAERVFEHNYLRPPLIQPYRCKNVLIEGVTLTRSPFWLVNPVLCSNVTVSHIHCESFGPNSDGCDPESCTDVLITHCVFDTGDDCIAIKSGRNADGRRINVPCQNIVIEHCEMKAGHGGVVIGSEISGGVKNLYAQYCTMSSPDLDRGIRIKTNSIRGGRLENLNYRNIDIGRVKDAVVVNFFYEEGDAGAFSPHLENITIENLTVEAAQRAFYLRGYDHTPIEGLTLNNIVIKNAQSPSIIENVENISINNVMINQQTFAL
ncbi:glycoside hydrolase family 28 protein [Alteromonas australica]|uniref:glycoside hydrolase family 28 protein n=1 Tax=Alteromonas australica TaxID=589873 RepID=UPI0035C81F04